MLTQEELQAIIDEIEKEQVEAKKITKIIFKWKLQKILSCDLVIVTIIYLTR